MNLTNDVNAQLSHKIAGLSPSSPTNQAKLQQEAATTIVDGRMRPTQWKERIPDIVDPKASTKARKPVKVDATTRPAQVFRKEPNMPALASHAAIKIAY